MIAFCTVYLTKPVQELLNMTIKVKGCSIEREKNELPIY